jgi:hypothetical protein
MWGGWGSNPRPADYEKPGTALRMHYLHGYHGTMPPMAPTAPFAHVGRSTNRSTVIAPASSVSLLCVIIKSARLTSATNRDTFCTP